MLVDDTILQAALKIRGNTYRFRTNITSAQHHRISY